MARALVLCALALLACVWLNPAAATGLQRRLSHRLRQTSTSTTSTTSDSDLFPFTVNLPPPRPYTPANGWLTGEILGGIKVRAFNQPDAGPTLADGVTKPYVGLWYYKNLREPAADKAYEAQLAAAAKIVAKDRTNMKRFVIHTTESNTFGMRRLHTHSFWTHFMIGRAKASSRTGPVFILQQIPLTLDGFGAAAGRDEGTVQIDVVGIAKEGVMTDPDVLAAIKAVLVRVNQYYPTIPLKVDTENCISFERASCSFTHRPLVPPAAVQDSFRDWVGVMGHVHLNPSDRYDPGVFDVSKILPASAKPAVPAIHPFLDPKSKCYTKDVAKRFQKVLDGCSAANGKPKANSKPKPKPGAATTPAAPAKF